jgi:hypothetical protein
MNHWTVAGVNSRFIAAQRGMSSTIFSTSSRDAARSSSWLHAVLRTWTPSRASGLSPTCALTCARRAANCFARSSGASGVCTYSPLGVRRGAVAVGAATGVAAASACAGLCGRSWGAVCARSLGAAVVCGFRRELGDAVA